jgi:hypothetical protein
MAKPDTYRLLKGCNNCKFAAVDGGLYCRLIKSLPLPIHETGKIMETREFADRMLAWRDETRVDANGICDEWEKAEWKQ